MQSYREGWVFVTFFIGGGGVVLLFFFGARMFFTIGVELVFALVISCFCGFFNSIWVQGFVPGGGGCIVTFGFFLSLVRVYFSTHLQPRG